ncbi:hypothetical protein [Chengkuizengella axinellae]|uniref:Uncharacterized protein n=1 Tax=Chengkuizengella axinellae TaxID=3064388 RepID=A0ABT9J1K6_9BACL|nr:hypothetical protein [Chengkuizengella sp. 2205SS18-9]MDP5275501.1 hypothetical protein [Chengkuizengella sp. 2205SS18-9]
MKLDWFVEENLRADDSGDGKIFIVSPTASVEYTLFKNNQLIMEATVTSSLSNTTDIFFLNDSFERYISSFSQDNEPNLTFCDETPTLGINCYQIKAKLIVKARLTSNMIDSSARLFSGNLNAILGD